MKVTICIGSQRAFRNLMDEVSLICPIKKYNKSQNVFQVFENSFKLIQSVKDLQDMKFDYVRWLHDAYLLPEYQELLEQVKVWQDEI